jgi:hypothetical protein
MVRFIILRHEQDHNSGCDNRDYYTLDIAVPELESALSRGGKGPAGFERHTLIGLEVLPQPPQQEEG